MSIIINVLIINIIHIIINIINITIILAVPFLWEVHKQSSRNIGSSIAADELFAVPSGVHKYYITLIFWKGNRHLFKLFSPKMTA